LIVSAGSSETFGTSSLIVNSMPDSVTFVYSLSPFSFIMS